MNKSDARQFQILAEFADRRRDMIRNSDAADTLSREFVRRFRARGDGGAGEVADDFLKARRARDEVGLAGEFHERGAVAVNTDGDRALARFASRLLRRLTHSLLAEIVKRGVNVAALGIERLLAVHDPRAAALAEFPDLSGRDRHRYTTSSC